MPAPRNPADLGADQEPFLARLFTLLLEALKKLIPVVVIQQAIKKGDSRIILRSAIWKRQLDNAIARLTPVEKELLRRGLVSGLKEVPGTRLRPQAATLAEALASPGAIARIQAVDATTRQTIAALVRSASRSYRASPSLATLRRLAEEVKPLIGLTPKQAAQLRRQWRSLRQAGQPEEAIRNTIAKRAQRMRELRAKAIADRGVIEDISKGRHEAWVEAQKRGEISQGAMKAWRDQGDNRVRPLHRAQTLAGPVPLNEPYPIQRVMHPPSNDPGCRCWDTLVDLEGRPAAAQSETGATLGPPTTAEERAARSAELVRRRAEFETQRQELEQAAFARQRATTGIHFQQDIPGVLGGRSAVEASQAIPGSRAALSSVPRFARVEEATAWITERYVSKIAMDGVTLPQIQEIADALDATLSGRRAEKLALLTWKGKHGRNLGGFGSLSQSITIQKQVAQKSARLADRTVANWTEQHRLAVDRAESYLAMLRSNTNIRGNIGAEIEKVERKIRALAATKRWTVYQDAERPLFSIVSHEAGHSLMWQRNGFNEIELFFREQLRATSSLHQLVSEYAATKDTELFAEITALVSSGRAAEVPVDLLNAWSKTIERLEELLAKGRV